MKYKWIGYTATIISALSLLPMIHKTTIKKSTHSISYLFTFLSILAQILLIYYTTMNRDFPMLFLAVYLLIINVIITISKWYYEKTGQDAYTKLKNNCDT